MNFNQEKWDEAIADWRRLVSKYPGTNEASQGQFMIARTLETKLGKLDEALEEYKKVNWGVAVPQRQSGRERLTEQNTVHRHRARLPHQRNAEDQAHQSRNIDTVTVRAYTVDMETYFRKMHDVRGVEGLDIALIDPDKTFEFKVPKYAEYQQLESEIEVPLPTKGPDGKESTSGVMAVTVSGKTLEATTLVMQSDLDVIREKLARRGVRVRREHAHRQSLAEGAAAHLQRPGRLRRRHDRRRRRVTKRRSRN